MYQLILFLIILYLSKDSSLIISTNKMLNICYTQFGIHYI
jgi:hypothetical protein